MTIGGWLSDATKQLVDAGISSPRLDAEIILAHTIKKPRTYVHAHIADEIEPRLEEIANARLDLRTERTPIAYIVGHKEFYGRLFQVSPATLIPRPESEEMITILRELLGSTKSFPTLESRRLVDIGAGSGCLGITAKLLYPELDVTLLDISNAALKIAEKNASAFGADIALLRSDLLQAYPYSPDIVLANLPYVDEAWDTNSPELRYEPPEALYATKRGLQIIESCFEELSHRMKKGGIAIFEADPRQWESIIAVAKRHGFVVTHAGNFAYSFNKL
ncbi:MAG TPA: HemK/PrmC family methyltransferase [Candidatus Saccharimonadales bacterium]